MPSCALLPDGKNAYPNALLSHYYVVCDKGRTLGTEECATGYFDPQSKECVEFVYGKSNLPYSPLYGRL